MNLDINFIKMKLKISKKHQKKIVSIKNLIEKHRKEEDKIVEKLAKDMGIDIDNNVGDTNNYETLWDYIYNDSHWMVELEQ